MVDSISFSTFQARKPVRADTEVKKHGDVLKNLTINIVDTYSKCNHDFSYDCSKHAPRRVLTKINKGVHNRGYDNQERDYICRVGDKIVNPDNDTYEILGNLGHGTFGQVVKCSGPGGRIVALKIVKNKPSYFQQTLREVNLLKMMNERDDPDDGGIVRMLDFFVYRKHMCIAFELMFANLYEVLKQNSFKGIQMALITIITKQLLTALQHLREACIIHCDLKPENVMLVDMQHTSIKLVDLGSACYQKDQPYTYIQSRFYRSPEVLLLLPPFTNAIDMWGLGCICAELFLGLPLFPGSSSYDQVRRQEHLLGCPPAHMLNDGKAARKYFWPPSHADDNSCVCLKCDKTDQAEQVERPGSGHPSSVDTNDDSDVTKAVTHKWRLKTRQEYGIDEHKKEPIPKEYFKFASLEQMVHGLPYRLGSSHQRAKEAERRRCFLQFLLGVLQVDPDERWTPVQAASSSFITSAPFDPDFAPSLDEPVQCCVRTNWGRNRSIALPCDNPAESYRPPLDMLTMSNTTTSTRARTKCVDQQDSSKPAAAGLAGTWSPMSHLSTASPTSRNDCSQLSASSLEPW